MVRKGLLICGIVSMLWYVVINIIVSLCYPGYDSVSQTVSELSAIGAPTRPLWFVLCIFYSLLFMAFSLGVWLSANGSRKLQIVAVVMFFDAAIGVYWPPMHRREVIAAGGGTLTDTLHLVWAFAHLVFMLLMISFGAAAFGKSFRVFSTLIVIAFIVFGVLTTRESTGIPANLPTPHAGIWERINIGAYMLWVIIFSTMLVKRNQSRMFKG